MMLAFNFDLPDEKKAIENFVSKFLVILLIHALTGSVHKICKKCMIQYVVSRCLADFCQNYS